MDDSTTSAVGEPSHPYPAFPDGGRGSVPSDQWGQAVPLFFGAMGLFAIVSAKRQMDATNAEWARTARTLGLSFTPWSMTSRPDLSGAVDGLGVRVTIEQRGSGKSKKSYTVFRVAYPDAGIDIGIGPETAFHRMGKWFGVQDIEIGDPVFDEAFVVAGDPSSLAGWLTESRRLAILRLAQGFPAVRIDRSTVSWDRRDAITDGDELVRTLRRLVSATHLVAGSAPDQQVVDRSFEAARSGQLADGIDQLVGADSPIGVEPRLMAAEWMVADGRVDQAAPAARRAGRGPARRAAGGALEGGPGPPPGRGTRCRGPRDHHRAAAPTRRSDRGPVRR